MTAMTIRDKWLAAALPALTTLLVGWLFFLRPAGRELSSLRQRVENQGPLSTRQALVAGAQMERADLERAIADKRIAPAIESHAFDRNLAMQQVSRLCASSGLSLNSIALDREEKLPPDLKEAATAMIRTSQSGSGVSPLIGEQSRDGSSPSTTAPQVWRIELSGGYPGILKLLEGIQSAKPLIVPLSVSMETGKNDRIPAKWVLMLWL